VALAGGNTGIETGHDMKNIIEILLLGFLVGGMCLPVFNYTGWSFENYHCRLASFVIDNQTISF
jgi:hypothetical protein